MTMHPTIARVTDRIIERSKPGRSAYLARIHDAANEGPARANTSCSNLAHVMAAASPIEKQKIAGREVPNLGIVTAYNDMLSAHQPFEDYPAQIKRVASENGAVALVASGVPAMCDGVTQGQDGMDLSLFSRDVIAMSTAVALSHDVFDAAIFLGICDKIVPGMLIGALSFGHLPVVFAPAGPMVTGISNKEKARVREDFAAGRVNRDELLESEAAAYHAPGTCTFYGTANSNQMLMELLGLQLPGGSFVNPGTPLRDLLTDEAVRTVLRNTNIGDRYLPVGEVIDERAIVNAIAGLLATGGSTNHTIHLIAIAKAAGITIDWGDFSELSTAVPLLARVYPNGAADVNLFHAAGGQASSSANCSMQACCTRTSRRSSARVCDAMPKSRSPKAASSIGDRRRPQRWIARLSQQSKNPSTSTVDSASSKATSGAPSSRSLPLQKNFGRSRRRPAYSDRRMISSALSTTANWRWTSSQYWQTRGHLQ